MTTRGLTFLLLAGLLTNNFSVLTAQNTDKEVIIIEKTVDEDGNVISQQIKRNKGQFSEDEIDDMIENQELPFMRSFDLEGMGFGEDLGSLFNPRTPSTDRPTLGVMLTEENNQLVVADVTPGSGAEEVDIRKDDKIISVDDVPVATVEDIKEILEKYDANDNVDVVIWRDGEEIKKSVNLRNNSLEGLFGGLRLPDNAQFKFFGDMESMDLDSLFGQLRNMSPDLFDFDGFNIDEYRQLGQEEDKSITKSNRPSLGLFIEDSRDGIRVTEVIKDGASEKAGIREDDIILRIDDNVVSSYRELSAWMNTKQSGDKVTLQVERNGKKKSIKITLD